MRANTNTMTLDEEVERLLLIDLALLALVVVITVASGWACGHALGEREMRALEIEAAYYADIKGFGSTR